jgi:hypothetical protein
LKPDHVFLKTSAGFQSDMLFGNPNRLPACLTQTVDGVNGGQERIIFADTGHGVLGENGWGKTLQLAIIERMQAAGTLKAVMAA